MAARAGSEGAGPLVFQQAVPQRAPTLSWGWRIRILQGPMRITLSTWRPEGQRPQRRRKSTGSDANHPFDRWGKLSGTAKSTARKKCVPADPTVLSLERDGPHAGRRRLRPRTLGRDGRRDADCNRAGEAVAAALSPVGSVPEGAGPVALAPVGDVAAGESAGRRTTVVVAERHHRQPHGDVPPLPRRRRRHPADDGSPCNESAGGAGLVSIRAAPRGKVAVRRGHRAEQRDPARRRRGSASGRSPVAGVLTSHGRYENAAASPATPDRAVSQTLVFIVREPSRSPWTVPGRTCRRAACHA